MAADVILIVGTAAFIVVAIVGACDIARHSDWYKRKHGLCWNYHCFRKVANCRASKAHNGPMCDQHCAEASYHEWFCGCGTVDGVPRRDKMISMIDGDTFSRSKIVHGERIDGRKLLN